MNMKQSNRLYMIEAVSAFLSLYPERIAESPGFADALQNVKDLADDIRAKDNQKSGATTGKVHKKNNTAKDLADKVLMISSALYLWAGKNNDAQTAALADFSRSYFIRSRDNEKVNKAVAIYNAANGKDLAFAKVTPEDIAGLNMLAAEYRNDISDLNSGTSLRVAAGKTLDEMIYEAMRILKQELDKYIVQFSLSDPEFYYGYKSARTIWDKRGKHTAEAPVEQEQEQVEA